MQTKRVSNEMLKNIKGYQDREAYVAPYASLTGDNKVNSDSSNIKEQVRRDKLVSSLREAIEKCEIKDGMTISFHHHFRAGDKLLMQVVDILAENKHSQLVF
ncbi:citrate lyase subunit alpha, partial [Terrisporobacter sp.]|uniref:citrate lyase subunit alpha n=1 Tax=Terrisporobacter sp. TaxID=1965305 RepID=UPI002897DA62